jgi:hypothetical protein
VNSTATMLAIVLCSIVHMCCCNRRKKADRY